MKQKVPNILCISDVCLDHYIYGNVSHIAQEGPIPILKVDREEYRLGMGANVAKHLKELGANVTLLFGSQSKTSEENMILCPMLNRVGDGIDYLYPMNAKNRLTIKQRTVCNGVYLSRNDYEDTSPIDIIPQLKDIEYSMARLTLDKYDAIILSDYGKGTVGYPQQIINYIKSQTDKPIFVDPDKFKRVEDYEGAFCIKANEKEALAITDQLTIEQAFSYFQHCTTVLPIVTLGDRGCEVLINDKVKSIKPQQTQVVDVTGCGDVFLASLVVNYYKNKNIIKSAKIANKIAAKNATKFGT